MTRARRAIRTMVVVSALGAGALTSCAEEAPAVPDGADETLVRGREIWSTRCATCHGSGGGGGTGPAISDGKLVEKYPDVAEQREVVRNGRNKMPSFSSLSDEELEGVIRYTREVL